MTDDEAFKELAVENLTGFGWSVTVDDIPDMNSIEAVFGRVRQWWNGLSQDTRDIITELDLADGLWNKGWLNEFPAMYSMISGNPFGRFAMTLDDIRVSLTNARDRAADYAAQHAVGRWEDDPASQAAGGSDDATDSGESDESESTQ
jgi:hypothetical protein